MAHGDKEQGLGEELQSGFAAHSLDEYEAIYRLVLSAYGYRCALTGERFMPDTGLLHPHLTVEAIRPREAGGPLDISNFMALEEHAAKAFRRGQVLIGDDYAIVIPRPEAIDRAVLVRINADRRLLVPAEAMFQPAPEHLAFHRRHAGGA